MTTTSTLPPLASLQTPSTLDQHPEVPPSTKAAVAPSQRLQRAREALHWTRPTLATLSGHEASTIFRYETGTRAVPEPLLAWLENLAEAFQALYQAAPPPPATSTTTPRANTGSTHMPETTNPKTMTNAELEAARDTARLACDTAWAAWEAARDAGATILGSTEWRAHGATQKELDRFSKEIQRREHVVAMRKLAPLIREPLSGPAWEEAWRAGPGRDAL